jgi:hypothetical protein
MLDGRVAGEALHLVLGYMVLMEEFRRVLRFQYLPLIVALEAGELGYVAVTGDDRRVALLAPDAPAHIELMVERELLVYLYVATGLEMTGVAACNILLLVLRLVKVAYETLHVGYRHVSALNDLRMAGGAAQLLLPLHLLNVAGMTKKNVLKDHVVLQISPLVATAL